MENKINDNELREFCITNYGTEELKQCSECPYEKECDIFTENHDGNTPLFG